MLSLSPSIREGRDRGFMGHLSHISSELPCSDPIGDFIRVQSEDAKAKIPKLCSSPVNLSVNHRSQSHRPLAYSSVQIGCVGNISLFSLWHMQFSGRPVRAKAVHTPYIINLSPGYLFSLFQIPMPSSEVDSPSLTSRPPERLDYACYAPPTGGGEGGERGSGGIATTSFCIGLTSPVFESVASPIRAAADRGAPNIETSVPWPRPMGIIGWTSN